MLVLKDYKEKIELSRHNRPQRLNEAERKLITDFLITKLQETTSVVPAADKRKVLRALMNVSMPDGLDGIFFEKQDRLLWTESIERGIVDCGGFEYKGNLALWQGDITRLNADAIVNAANGKLLGCFLPEHRCIDNVIHSAGGMQIRKDCDTIMRAQGHDEPAGAAKITGAYNLPSKYILHTVGPVVYGRVTAKERAQLESCYFSCLELAKEAGLTTVAFCCISTGEFRFPKETACEIATKTVKDWLRSNAGINVIFNVFLDEDRMFYERGLGIKN